MASGGGGSSAADGTHSSHPFYIRGIYESDDACIAAAAAVRPGYNQPPSPEFDETAAFATKAECEEWSKRTTVCTNPDYPQCKHVYTTLCDWQQVRTLLLQPLAALRQRLPHRPPAPLPDSNVFKHEEGIRAFIRDRLDLPFHSSVNEESTLNTLRYLFFHMRCGIFVCIRGGQLRMFVPFVNKDYTNTWADIMTISEDSIDRYEEFKRETLKSVLGKDDRREILIRDKSKWWANGNIVCNVNSSNYWGDSYLPQLRHMLQTLCKEREVPDCEFFINKRDFPQLKRNLTEPYDFIYDRDDPPLQRELYNTYAPIASFFIGAPFADVPLVCTDDWETATGLVFPPHGVDLRSAANRKAHDVPWDQRTATAIFRGNSTGPGTDVQTNQRIHLAAMSNAWARSAQYGPDNAVDGIRYLDAGIVQWNLRDRKQQGKPMSYIDPLRLDIPLAERVPMYKQAAYKYHLYVDGHCAAMRYASMMPLGAVILKVASVTKADSMWYWPLLRPYDWRSDRPDPAGDHIPVAADLSDLGDVITWCKTHDEECQRIAANSKTLYGRLIAREGQLDFLQLLLHDIGSRFRSTHTTADTTTQILEAAARQGLDVAAQAESAGCVPASLCGALATPPFTGSDWFGCDNEEYCDTLIGPSLTKPPCMKDKATTRCACPQCVEKRAAADAARKQAAQTIHGGAAMGGAGGAGGAGASTGTARAASMQSAPSSASAAAAAPAKPKGFVDLDKARAAALAAAARAAQLAGAAAASGGGTGGAASGAGQKRKRLDE